MAVIHHTTLTPTKLELLADWLPGQPWYLVPAAGGRPHVVKAGGFRLDDPDGEVGVEFLIVADEGGSSRPCFAVPMTYRAAALAAAPPGALLGTCEHGVLGRRWVYDAVHDPVAVAALLGLLQGAVPAQAQDDSETPDPSVTGDADLPTRVFLAAHRVVHDGVDGTDILVETVDVDGEPADPLTIRVIRRLRAGAEEDAVHPGDGLGDVTGGWRLSDGTRRRGRLVTLR